MSKIKLRRNYVLTLTVLLLTIPSVASYFNTELSADSERTPHKNLDIYLLIGQSNMAGRAEISGSDLDTLENVYLYTGIPEKEWEKAANPFNKYSSIRKGLQMQKLGPGYHFAKNMLQPKSNYSIGLVVNAKGGTNISLWKPGGEFYNEAVKRTKEAMQFGTLKGILWHQGESDASKKELYTPKIIELIEALRKDFEIPDLPFVAGQLSKEKPKRKAFNRMIKKLPKRVDNCAVVSTKNTSTIDNTHFDSASQRLLGERYANEMKKLIDDKK